MAIDLGKIILATIPLTQGQKKNILGLEMKTLTDEQWVLLFEYLSLSFIILWNLKKGDPIAKDCLWAICLSGVINADYLSIKLVTIPGYIGKGSY